MKSFATFRNFDFSETTKTRKVGVLFGVAAVLKSHSEKSIVPLCSIQVPKQEVPQSTAGKMEDCYSLEVGR